VLLLVDICRVGICGVRLEDEDACKESDVEFESAAVGVDEEGEDEYIGGVFVAPLSMPLPAAV
jgi:hypothetical protein